VGGAHAQLEVLDSAADHLHRLGVLGIRIWPALALGPVVLAAIPLITAEGDCPNAETVRAHYEELGAINPQPHSDGVRPRSLTWRFAMTFSKCRCERRAVR
jgi:hypothetical protein